jgi:hypothetical protein
MGVLFVRTKNKFYYTNTKKKLVFCVVKQFSQQLLLDGILALEFYWYVYGKFSNLFFTFCSIFDGYVDTFSNNK